jgi:tetratricopeptide (TPR) repeat protein
MTKGNQSEALDELERYYMQIHNAGHSVADKARIGMLLARAIALCVGAGTLSQGALLRARNVLGVELERLSGGADSDLLAQVALELAKTYQHAPTPDPRAAYALLENIAPRLRTLTISTGRGFDLTRLTYQAAKQLNLPPAELVDDEALRARARELGGLSVPLAELAIARRSTDVDTERLEAAADAFEEGEFLSGAYEAVFVLATTALDRAHNALAERYCKRALALAVRGGCMHGELLALSGLFQSASLAEDHGEFKARCKAIVTRLESEFALGSSGLNVAAAQQISGDIDGALRTAKKCEKFFNRAGIAAFQAQALAIVGTCEAHKGYWKRAESAWRRGLEIEIQRHAFVAAAERAAFVVQAKVMHDFATHGGVRSATRVACEALLQQAQESLRAFGSIAHAVSVQARLHSVHAQLCIMSKEHLAALRAFSVARGLYDSLGMGFEVSLTDAFIGLSMIEVGKATNPELLEEAVLTLQRAFQFFSSPSYPALRWKLLYYMAVAGLFISNNTTNPVERLKWRDLSVAWLRSAERDLEGLADGPTQTHAPIGFETEFAPGVKADALRELRAALGMRQQGRRKQDDEEKAEKSLPASGEYIH